MSWHSTTVLKRPNCGPRSPFCNVINVIDHCTRPWRRRKSFAPPVCCLALYRTNMGSGQSREAGEDEMFMSGVRVSTYQTISFLTLLLENSVMIPPLPH